MEYWLHVATIFLLYTILGLSLNLLMGYGGLVSMAHAAFYGIGAYASALALMKLDLNFLAGFFFAILVSGIIGVLIAFPALRVKHEYLILLTTAFQMVVYAVMVSWVALTGGRGGLTGVPRPSIFRIDIITPGSYLVLTSFMAILCFLVSWRITSSPFGRVLKAMREDEIATLAIGKNLLKYKATIFMISGMMAGAAGSLFAHYMEFINPFSFTLHESIFIIAIVIIGGTANLPGSVLGAFLLILVPEVLRFLRVGEEIAAPIREIIYGVLLILFMRFRPQGLIPEYLGIKRRTKPLRAAEDSYLTPAKSDQKEVLLQTEGLDKSFGGIRAVKDFSLALERGVITALVGPNGAGKTTLFNLITGFIPPDGGKIFYKQKEITGLPPFKACQAGISRSFQEVRIFGGMTVLDNVLVAFPSQKGESLLRLFLTPWAVKREEERNLSKALKYLEFVGLNDKPFEIANELSFAEQKLLAFARLLATEGEVLLLDEPASGVDPTKVGDMLQLVKKAAQMGKAICIVEHNLDIVRELADIVYFMDQGEEVARGAPEELMKDRRLAEIYFGV